MAVVALIEGLQMSFMNVNYLISPCIKLIEHIKTTKTNSRDILRHSSNPSGLTYSKPHAVISLLDEDDKIIQSIKRNENITSSSSSSVNPSKRAEVGEKRKIGTKMFTFKHYMTNSTSKPFL